MSKSRLIAMTTEEKEISEFTRKLVRITGKLNALVKMAETDKDAAFSELGRKLWGKSGRTQFLINKYVKYIEENLKKHSQLTVSSAYFNYFLLKVAQYNALFFTIKEHGLVSIAKEETPILKLLGYAPIQHELLGCAAGTRITYQHVKRRANAEFRDPIQKDYKGRMRYYYSAVEAQDDYKDGQAFPPYYAKANRQIGMATQKTNVRSALTIDSLSQLAANFFRGKDLTEQKREKILFKSAMEKVKAGEAMTVAEQEVLQSGRYYRNIGSPIAFSLEAKDKNAKAKHFHINHAGQTIDMGLALVTVDPVNYQSYSKIYSQKVKAGVSTSDYLTHIVIISHNHYDHLDEKTAREAWGHLGDRVLFVVPAGDAKYLKDWGFKHVVEMGSWNDSVDVLVEDAQGEGGKISVRALPARHASNREINPSMPDINTSLYMGFLLHRDGADHVTLITGDTAVLDDEHIAQLTAYALEHNVTISSACIAAGPDRPRSWMECTHQSSADAIALHAQLNVINAKVMARRRDQAEDALVTREDFFANPCEGIAYHQGCFRLGVLNFNDVEGTITRMLAALSIYQGMPVDAALEDLCDELAIMDGKTTSAYHELLNFAFADMDRFERIGLINTLAAYVKLFKDNQFMLSAQELCRYIGSHIYLPKSGQLLDFNKPTHAFIYNYKNLIVNRDETRTDERAYEFVLNKFKEMENVESLMKKFLLDARFDEKNLVRVLLKIYLDKPAYALSTHSKKSLVKKALKKLDQVKSTDELINLLIQLRGDAVKWQTADEVQRDEGHLETFLLIAHGLLTDSYFRIQFQMDFEKQKNQPIRGMSNLTKCLIGVGITAVLTAGLIALSIFVPPVGLFIASYLAIAASAVNVTLVASTLVTAIAFGVVGAVTTLGLILGFGVASCKLRKFTNELPQETPVGITQTRILKTLLTQKEKEEAIPLPIAPKQSGSFRGFIPQPARAASDEALPKLTQRRHSFHM
jgi:L-ascorbate metabolism protein UlaG (beta-lactamase superfamily)